MCSRLWLVVGLFCYVRAGCDLSCDGVRHTLCEYPAGGGDGCLDYHGGLTPEEEEVLVQLHNEMRRKVAIGETPASDMRELSYDPGAAEVAQRWADQCGEMGHDRCRAVPGEDHVGQNICLVSGYTTGTPPSRGDALSTCVTSWYEEVENFRGSVGDFDPSPEDLGRVGHFSQLAWASTDRVGCGLSQYAKGADYQYRLVCNYLPGGNVRHREIYKVGPPCSQCPSDTSCSQQWPGLCRSILPHTEPIHGGDAQADEPDVGSTPSPTDLSLVLLLTFVLYHI